MPSGYECLLRSKHTAQLRGYARAAPGLGGGGGLGVDTPQVGKSDLSVAGLNSGGGEATGNLEKEAGEAFSGHLGCLTGLYLRKLESECPLLSC